MTPTTEEQRAEFEAWAKEKGLIQESFGIRSVNSMCEIAEIAWQAATAAASRRSPPLAAEGVEGTITGTQVTEIARKLIAEPVEGDEEFINGVAYGIGSLNSDILAAITKAGKREGNG